VNFPGVRVFNKFPGGSDFTGFRHRQRIHGIAEMYLIAAEAGNNPTRLSQLRQARGAGTVTTLDELRDEWTREKIGEGFRIENLRRWEIGFNGRVPQDPGAVHLPGNFEFTGRHVTSDQLYRFTFPIPQNDIRTNPNMVQTPSWVNPQ